jgi:hypothetical protein
MMVDESVHRRATFREGKWLRMADGQDWSFPRPPAPGADLEFDATLRTLHEAESWDEALRAEFALAILLLSRNYDLMPREYEQIFGFGTRKADRSLFQSAFSGMISESSHREQHASLEDRPGHTTGTLVLGLLQSLRSACATRVRSLLSGLSLRSN